MRQASSATLRATGATMFMSLPLLQEPTGARSSPQKSRSSNLIWRAGLSVVRCSGSRRPSSRWHGAVAGLPWLASPNTTRPVVLTATYALVTILVARAVQAVLLSILRSGWGTVASLLVSAAVFALDHPWLAALPVLAMGACATLAFERSRSLYAAILVHALYNGALVLMQLVG